MSTAFPYLRRRVRSTPAATRPTTPAAVTAKVPLATPGTQLTSDSPVARLSALASGIGTLVVDGVSEGYIETADGRTFDIRRGGVPAFGKRALAEFSEGGQCLIGLRHIREARRIVFDGTDIRLSISFGLTITVPGPANVGISIADGVLEVRRDEPAGPINQTYALTGGAS